MKNFAILALILISFIGCAAQSQIPLNPICGEKGFEDSWICSQLAENGFQYAEDFNDLILDANDISLILNFYSAKDLERVLDILDRARNTSGYSYTDFIGLVLKETEKANRIGSIIKRRAGILKSPELIRESDKKLIGMSIASLRASVGIRN